MTRTVSPGRKGLKRVRSLSSDDLPLARDDTTKKQRTKDDRKASKGTDETRRKGRRSDPKAISAAIAAQKTQDITGTASQKTSESVTNNTNKKTLATKDNVVSVKKSSTIITIASSTASVVFAPSPVFPTASLPISQTLPVEVLEQIFAFAVESRDFFADDLPLGWLIAHVCQQWRAVMFAFVGLWTNFVMTIPTMAEWRAQERALGMRLGAWEGERRSDWAAKAVKARLRIFQNTVKQTKNERLRFLIRIAPGASDAAMHLLRKIWGVVTSTLAGRVDELLFDGLGMELSELDTAAEKASFSCLHTFTLASRRGFIMAYRLRPEHVKNLRIEYAQDIMNEIHFPFEEVESLTLVQNYRDMGLSWVHDFSGFGRQLDHLRELTVQRAPGANNVPPNPMTFLTPFKCATLERLDVPEEMLSSIYIGAVPSLKTLHVTVSTGAQLAPFLERVGKQLEELLIRDCVFPSENESMEKEREDTDAALLLSVPNLKTLVLRFKRLKTLLDGSVCKWKGELTSNLLLAWSRGGVLEKLKTLDVKAEWTSHAIDFPEEDILEMFESLDRIEIHTNGWLRFNLNEEKERSELETWLGMMKARGWVDARRIELCDE